MPHSAKKIFGLMPHCDETFFGTSRKAGSSTSKANSVMAIDFMQNFVDKNKELNGHRSNVTVQQADVTKFDLPTNKK